MIVKQTHTYKHDVAKVYGLLTDPEFVAEKYQAVGARNVEIIQYGEDEDGDYILETVREIHSALPDFAKKFLGEWNKVQQIEIWEPDGDGFLCSFTVDALDAPVKIAGTQLLSPIASGCVNEVNLTVSCSVPLLGGKLAKVVGGDADTTMTAEHAYTQDALAGG